MSTLEALNAISEAIEAHKRQPELEAQIKALTDDRDFVKLERDEAERTIERLKARISELEATNATLKEQIYLTMQKISELEERNSNLDASLSDVTRLYNDAQYTIIERELETKSLILAKESLEARLSDAKSYGERLAETLRTIGAKIVAAVEVPEVTSEKPFPVDNTVAVPSPTNVELDSALSSEPNPVVADSPRTDMVNQLPTPEPVEFWEKAKDESTNSPGCYTSPITPAKLWWEY